MTASSRMGVTVDVIAGVGRVNLGGARGDKADLGVWNLSSPI